jgi:hypothetical protein
VRRFFVLSGLTLTGMLAIAPIAQARGDRAAECNRNARGVTIKGDLTVPAGGTCRLVRSTVRGDVKVREGGYFQATKTTVRGDVKTRRGRTLFIEDNSKVKGNVVADGSARAFVFDSTIGGRIDIARSTVRVNVCGNTVRGDIAVQRSGRDILVGDPLAIDCAGNRVTRGDIEVDDNVTDVELVVRGNRLDNGTVRVRRNAGPSVKFVDNNRGDHDLLCIGNAAPFAASGNTGWDRQIGQCATP